MEVNKKGYDEIEIPEEVSQIMGRVKARYRKRAAVRRKVTGAVMALAVMFASSNTPPVYAALSQVPVLGTVVKIFHVGSGGTVTDGIRLNAVSDEDCIRISFARGTEGAAQSAPAYKVERFGAPDRLVLTVYGVRNFDPQKTAEQAEASSYVRSAYREILLDDSAVRIVMELEPDTGFETAEYREPGGLEIRLFPEEQESRKIWFVRSEKMEMSEGLALLAEQLSPWGGVIAGTADGQYVVSVGEFETEEEAGKMMEILKEQGAVPEGFSVDSCMSGEKPD